MFNLKTMDIYQKAVESMQSNEIDHHQSDLYLKVTPISEELVKNFEFKNNVKRFYSRVDNSSWFDIPFAYTPFWNK